MINSTDQAFPASVPGFTYGDGSFEPPFLSEGLTKREYFAALFLQGMMASGYYEMAPHSIFVEAPLDAVKLADAVIEALK